MKQLTTGFLMGVVLAMSLFLFTGMSSAQDDSIKVYLDRLETLIREEISKNVSTGRFELQSFSIDRTHWHYMLDTATGELYRMELGRTPDRSNWILIANGMIEQHP
ncbi:MAG: hypothetical protein ACE5GH_05040 [Fidelibacterota bacterium]